jgi:hypothetical protein
MPKLKNKNTNKNKNNIRITINNNSSTSKRKRKSGGKGKQSGSTSNNPMPTIIQMHHHNPPATQSQIADNSYGIGMAEKIDALAGGLTRVFERIETQQQDNYTRDKNEAFLQKSLRNRERELSTLTSHPRTPSSIVDDSLSSLTLSKAPTVSSHAPPLQQPVIAPTMDQIPPATEPLASGSAVNSGSYLGSTLNSKPLSQQPSDTYSVGSGISAGTPFGNLYDYLSFSDSDKTSNPLPATRLILSPEHNMDHFYNDGHLENQSDLNPMYTSKSAQKRAKRKEYRERHLKKKELQNQNPEGPQLIRPYRKQQTSPTLKGPVADKILKG